MRLIDQLKNLYSRPNFEALIDHWRTKRLDGEHVTDVYGAALWKEFATFDGKPLLSEPGNIAFIMYVDWFGPFKNSNYSLV